MKKNGSKIICLLLALCMIAGLCACGSDGTAATSTSSTSAPAGGSTAASVSGTVYETSYIPVDTNSYLWSNLVDENGFLTIISEVIGNNTPEGVIPDYEGQYDVRENHLYRIGLDGSKTQLTAYAPLSAETEHENGDVYVSTYAMGSSPDGRLVSIDDRYEVWSDAADDVQKYSDDWYAQSNYAETFYLRVLNADGSEISTTEVDFSNYGYFYPNAITMDNDGNVYVACDSGLLILSTDGEIRQEISCRSGYVGSLLTMADGSIYAYISDSENTLARVDAASGSFGESYTLPSNAYSLMKGSNGFDIIYTSGSSLYGFNLGDTDGTLILNWLSNDVNSSDLCGITMQDDGTIYALCSTWNEDTSDYTGEIAQLKQVPADSVTQKQTLTLATSSLSYNIQTQLVKFNRTSNSVHINVVEYSDPSLLETEIMAGNVPDLIDLNCISEKALAAKGLLVDIYPLIDADSELNRSDFFENVLSALETNGCLYNVTPSFQITTLAGASSIVGDTPGWTYDDLYAALEKMPEGCSIMDTYTTRDTVLQTGLYMDASQYYNTATGECNFKNDSFTALLEFASRFPTEVSDEDYVDSSQLIATGEQMLMNAYLSDLDSIGQYDAMFGGSATFIGYPCTSGTGNLISCDNGIAITTACADQDAAWQFLRVFYTSDYQKSLSYTLPIRKDVFDAKIQDAMTVKYQQDENGNYLLDENGEKIPETKFMYYVNGETLSADCLTQEQADKICETVESSTRRVSWDDSSIFDIVNEEAAAYFAGQKTAEEVEDIIQSRVGIYLREQL